ncbi:hypothetical protein KGF57_002634 [Candida theae]|uniref:Cullin family profile domain-containing protein n=1 Tax=Candida theae TaxID=1198502 RepID=A0AAD5BEN1_9ASCO|nr:uncharacterized protein KGF57_002634 [Candida theae]KAI5958279.1 hypothetical protein KGF57_002634 [Candida theae]
MPKTIPQILDFRPSSSTSSLSSSLSVNPHGEGSPSMASTPSLGQSITPSTSKIRTSHLLQHRPKKRKRTPIIQDEESSAASTSLSESSQRQLDASKQILYNVIDRVLDGQILGHSLSFLYGRVEAVCRYKHNEQKALADYLFEKLDAFFEKLTAVPYPPAPQGGIDDLQVDLPLDFGQRVIDDWKSWNGAITKLSQVFAFLEKSYLRPHHRRESIQQYGEEKFRQLYFGSKSQFLPPEFPEFPSSLNEIGDSGKWPLDVWKSLFALGFAFYHMKYSHCVPDDYSNRTRFVFSDLMTLRNRLVPNRKEWRFDTQIVIQRKFDNLDIQNWQGWFCTDSFKRASRFKQRLMILDEEISFHIKTGTEKKILDDTVSKLKFLLIFKNDFVDLVLESFDELSNSPEEMALLNKMCEDTATNYELNAKEQLAYVWKQFIKRKFQEAIDKCRSSSIDHELYPNAILYLNSVYEDLLQKVVSHYTGWHEFEGVVPKSVEEVVNKFDNNTFIIQQLCKVCDLYLKSKLGPAFGTSRDLWHSVKSIYHALKNRDDFCVAYKKELSRRLILGKASSLADEYSLASWFTLSLHGKETSASINSMFEDLNSSEEVYAKLVNVPAIDFKPLVLEKSVWTDIPSQNLSTIPLPQGLANVLNDFGQAFCKSDERNGRKRLDWSNYKLHQLTIAGHFNSGGEKSITANMLQAMILLLFNDCDEYTLEQLIDKTKMDAPLLQAVLNTMVTGKYKILKQQGNVIKYNHNFKDKSKNIKLPIIKESAQGSNSRKVDATDKEMVEVIEKNRNDEFKSVVVRIMKQAKSLTMTDLLNQSIEILQKRRPVPVIDLKSAIERLITDEFLKRKTRDTIEYIA